MEKVNASDLASLMPTSSDGEGTANLMAKLLEMQNKLIHLEGNSTDTCTCTCTIRTYYMNIKGETLY